ncbi:ScbR family autoregulator-binding transcription factor [Streptomyces triculaminicus]|uniref:ScbR family autoregulator-binding transcription factor n=1 Tax=Streptomyces triculaminicus TaxID=2816232 RepID=UPI0033C0B6B4
MPQQERAIRTRWAILEAAGKVFDEWGYEAATIAQILAQAEVTRGALYFHFSSKEDLARGVLDTAVTTEGVLPQELKLQELVDASLLLAYRLTREPLLRASLRLSVDPRARALFGTRWPDWIEVLAELLRQAGANGETLPGVDPVQVARLLVGSWTGVQLVSDAVPQEGELVHEIAALFRLVLPAIVVPEVLTRLDVAADRPLRLMSEAGVPAPN